jgi:hemerythrin
MPLMTWSDSWSVQVKSLDEQHKMLVSLINKLHDAMAAGKGHEVVGRVLDDLLDYTRKHFSHEEGMMRRHEYPDLANHARIHAEMVAKVVDLRTKVSGGTKLTLEVMNFLKDWLTKHIQGTDQKYSTCLAGKL